MIETSTPETSMDIPEKILQFRQNTLPIPRTVVINHRNKGAVKTVHKLISNGQKVLSGEIGNWLRIKVEEKKTLHVILMLRKYDETQRG